MPRAFLRSCCLSFCLVFLAAPSRAADFKFASPADLTRALKPVAGAEAVAVVKDDGGVLRFQSTDKARFAQMAFASAPQSDGEASAVFRFGGGGESFGFYVRVGGESEDCYLALVNTSPEGQGTVRLFKVPPRVQAEEVHLLTKPVFVPALPAGVWCTLKVRTATQGGAVQVTAELNPGGGALATATATDINGIKTTGAVQLRFFAADADRKIDVKQATVTAGKGAGH